MKRSPWARTISATSRRGGVIFYSVSENVGCRRGWKLCSASSGLGMACRCLGERCTHRTARIYVRIVRDLAEYFHEPPDKLGPEQIRQYQAHLFEAKKFAPATVSQYVSALRFFFVKTLRRHFLAEYIPFPKSRRRLPTVLSPDEVTRLIDAAGNLYHRTLLMTLYSTALRRAELCRLKVQDIDSQRMMIRINQGKGGREVPLSPKL